jgi:hypothetical protein
MNASYSISTCLELLNLGGLFLEELGIEGSKK